MPMLELRPLTPGVAPLKPGVVFGRDTSTTSRPLGIAHPQVSRVQGRTCAKPDGTLEVVALGIGRMRVVRADAASVKSSTMVQGQSVVLREGDELRLLAVERRCACPLARPCACAESTGDRLQIVAAWRLEADAPPPPPPPPAPPPVDVQSQLSSALRTHLGDALSAWSNGAGGARLRGELGGCRALLAELRSAFAVDDATAEGAPAAAEACDAIERALRGIAEATGLADAADGAADAPAAAAVDECAACEEASQTSVCSEAMSQESSDGYIDRLGARRWVEANAAGLGTWRAEDREPLWVQCDRCDRWRLPVTVEGGAPPPPRDGERWTCRRFPHPGYAHCRAAAAPVLVGADFQAALPPDAGSPSRERGEARVTVDAATINERPEAEFGSFDRGVLRMVDPDAVADNYPPRKWARR